MVAHNVNISNWEIEIGRYLWGQPSLQSEFKGQPGIHRDALRYDKFILTYN